MAACASDVGDQVAGLPDDATHLFVSAGGNDALNASGILRQRVGSVAEAAAMLGKAQSRFLHDYSEMLKTVLATRKPVVICTVYDSIPQLHEPEQAALSLFNDAILRAAFAARIPVLDLRQVCDRPEDYSALSPIEPSAKGGAKIARIIAQVAVHHDFSRERSVVFGAS